MSSALSRRALLIAAALVAVADASAQARGSVTVSATVLPSPALLSRNLPPSAETGHSLTASAEFGNGGSVASARPAISMIGRPREVARVGDQVELSVTIVVQSNVSYRLLVEAPITADAAAVLVVQDVSGQFRPLSGGSVVAVEAAGAGSNRQAEIRYRVKAATAAGLEVVPMRLTLQTSAML